MIRLDEVTKIYAGMNRPAVDALSFEVPEGETCVLIGPSGCGKTTTLKMVNRLIEPSGGAIYINDENVLNRNPNQLRRDIGYVIQQIGLFPHMTIRDNVAVVPKLLGWDAPRTDARVDELLDLMGLPPDEYRDRYPRELSGGQRQRVGVARALAADPPVMLMDEPFGAIDPITRDRLQNEFLRLQRQIKKTIMFVTHDIDEAIKMGTRICILRVGGVLAQYDTPRNILANPADQFVSDFVGADRGLKQLNLVPVNDVMNTDIDLIRWDISAEEAQAEMRDAGLDSMFVVDDKERLVGYVTLDMLDNHAGGKVGDLANEAPATTEPEATMKDAFSEMLAQGVRFMPVIGEKEKVVGIVSSDEAQELIRSDGARR